MRTVIADASWIFAKTYADTAPHEYCLRLDMKHGDVSFENMILLANAIWEYGYKERYGTYIQTYLEIDDHKYWSMDPTPEKTDLINRAPLKQEDTDRMVQLWKSGKRPTAVKGSERF
ncbi:MAG TPA: hypothetical protein ENN67_05445 [Firmicutes bacterium]|nr:hypothetical protein [Bacillota bacterium]